jgi:hypothetical protein
MQALFGSSVPGVDWERTMSQRLAVLLDFRQVFDVERRRFKMIWAFNYFLDFVRHRGAGRHYPISLMIDELSSLFSIEMLAGEILGKDLDELINVIARNYRIWLTIAHQEQFQLTERIQKTFMTMGTQILGSTSDRDAAISSAKQFFRYDPYWVKKYEPAAAGSTRSEEFTIEEQFLIYSYYFTDLGRFQFLVRPAIGEGKVIQGLRRISIEGLDQGQYPDEELVALARELLMKRYGKPVGEVFAEINMRLAQKMNIPKPSVTPSKEENIVKAVPPLWTD